MYELSRKTIDNNHFWQRTKKARGSGQIKMFNVKKGITFQTGLVLETLFAATFAGAGSCLPRCCS